MAAAPAKFVTRRYVFDASALSIFSKPNWSVPSRVDVVTALICKCFMEAVAEEDEPKPLVMAHSVNLRRRAVPPFPEDSFGNFVWTPVAVCNNPKEKKLRELLVDFGWGKPVWLSGNVADNSESETVGNGNFVTWIDTRGGGIEACCDLSFLR
ncbi:hypothetical protein SASPL_156741 [Salvia splendens]|uniref:Uncharacterized protein n=1 Tax=Salvia splendens TaxID=180675 RepID=A0A8X8YWA1_SALSN|nr:hypothetical protein SASPL_156741 [Salvia splendens]